MVRAVEVNGMHTRKQWSRLVRRWRRSGRTARQFAASAGVNPATLSHWAWRLGREEKLQETHAAPQAVAASFLELVGASPGDSRFELELGNGRRLRIPEGFDAGALKRLLEVVEGGR
jgi:transposase